MVSSAQDLLALPAELDGVLDASPDAVVILTPDYRIARFNATAEQQYGYPFSEVIGRHVGGAWRPGDRENDIAIVDRVMDGAVVGPVIRKRIRRDGSSFWVSLVGVPIRDRSGDVIATYWRSRDVTAERRAQRLRDEQNARFTTAFEVSPIGMLVATFDGDHTMVNPSMCRMLGYSREEFAAIKGPDLRHPDDAGSISQALQSLRDGQTATEARRCRRRHKDGHYVWVEETVTVLERDPASAFQILVQCRDVSVEVEQERRTQFLMDHDHLTGLLNRRAFERICARHHEAATRSGSLLVIDLDGFKRQNDTYGHATGDRILVAVAGGLAAALRKGDVAGRLGGDEFAVLLPESDGAVADAVAGRLVRAIAEAVEEFDDGGVPVTASVGVADFEGVATVDEVIQRADRAMYRAKRTGRDRWSR